MNEWKLRELICEIGRRLYHKGFAAANDGNISIRLGDNRFLCTPTGVSKGYMKPDDLCIVDIDGKQLAGTKKRTSEIMLHLAVYRERADINGVLHCHPPHATAFAMVHEPIPKCLLPEVEVFLGEVPIAKYETPGTKQFADTVVPYVKDCNTIILANHGTIAFAKELMTAYFNTEILDAYCRMLILARQLGPLEYIGEKQVGELMDFKKRLGLTDPRLAMENCDLCGNSIFREGYSDFSPVARAFNPPAAANSCSGLTPRTRTELGQPFANGASSPIAPIASTAASDMGVSAATQSHIEAVTKAVLAGQSGPMSPSASNSATIANPDLDDLVKKITDQVMLALQG